MNSNDERMDYTDDRNGNDKKLKDEGNALHELVIVFSEGATKINSVIPFLQIVQRVITINSIPANLLSKNCYVTNTLFF